VISSIALAAALAWSCQFVAAQAGATQAERGGNVAIDDRLFEQVPLNSRERTACSPPSPGANWRGILINAPSRADIKNKKPGGIPICGVYTLDMNAIAASPPLTLVAVDKQRGETFKGAVVDDDPSPEVPPPGQKPFDPAQFKGVATSSYFNPDRAKYVKLPARAATYEVFAEYGGAVSNRVTIQVLAP
jgi:hypothetical protein